MNPKCRRFTYEELLESNERLALEVTIANAHARRATHNAARILRLYQVTPAGLAEKLKREDQVTMPEKTYTIRIVKIDETDGKQEWSGEINDLSLANTKDMQKQLLPLLAAFIDADED
jgi:hypothetical protein